MNNTSGKVSFVQIFLVMMLFNGILSHVILNPIILDASGRDAWISVLLTTVLYIPWCILLVYIMKKSGGQKLQVWLAKQTSPFFSWLLIAPVALQLYVLGGMTIIQTTLWTISNYLPLTPQSVLIIVLVAICHYSAKQGVSAIAINSGILLPIVVVLGYFVTGANLPEKNWSLLTPIMEHGWGQSLNGMIYAGGAFTEISLLLLLQHQLKSKVRAWQIVLLAFVLVYITLGPIVGAITEFGPVEAAKQMVSPYEQWRLVRVGNHIEHMDFLSVFQWLAGASVRISLAQYMLADLMPFRKPKSRNWFLLGITLSYILLGLISRNTFYLEMFKSYLVITLFMTLALTIIWAVIALFSKPVAGDVTHE
ncbi:endospore germination permease [Gorillibacterium massiliense]|uniref:endospore germination permease n=1 Tax=Gorillibacterium massiliense TaxID=1280390 RepID=UPI0004AE0576|nr:endospore germination permease [Gorillibacterium massiliense]